MHIKGLVATILILLVSLLVNDRASAQEMDESYREHWKRIEKFESDGLPRSAYAEAEKIFDLASTDGNDVQQLKALIFLARYTPQLEEDGWNASINRFRDGMSNLSPQTKALAHLLLAEAFQHYLSQNAWRMQGRTSTGAAGPDIRTWDTAQFATAVLENLEEALQDRAMLQSTELGDYSPLLREELAARHLRPTLYDLITHHALQLLSAGFPTLPKPIDPFVISADELLSDAEAFVAHDISSADSLSPKLRAVILLQQLVEFRLKDTTTPEGEDAFLDAEMARLQFVHNEGYGADKDSLYVSALLNLADRFRDATLSAEVRFRAARAIMNQGASYPADKNARWKKKEAYDLCSQTIESAPQSSGAANCRALLDQIRQPSLRFTVEQVLEPGQKSLARVTFANVADVHVKAFRLTSDQLIRFMHKNSHQDREQFVMGLFADGEPEWSDSITLPDTGDYQSHSTEISIGALSPGPKIFIVSNEATGKKNSIIMASVAQVSSLGFLHRGNRTGTNEVFVMDRFTGKVPTNGCAVATRTVAYNRNVRIGEPRLVQCDKNGLAEITLGDNVTYIAEARSGEDRLLDLRQYASHSWSRSNDKYNQTWLFTDRGIYRPGQTVYFKALLANGRSNDYSLRENAGEEVTLLDANGQEVASFKGVSNSFGSFSGSFVLPVSGLTGHYTIESDHGGVSFRVEEYKRPTFTVELDSLQGTPVLHNTVRISGSATGFAGNAISDSRVTYRVIRTVRFYPWFYYSRWWSPPSWQQAEIAFGTAETAADGSFEIEFIAQPDLSVDPKTKPVFDYRVTAEITDVSGETRSGETMVSVGYEAFSISSNLQGVIDSENFPDFVINANNTNGVGVSVDGTFVISRLDAPPTARRERLWGTVDTAILDEEYFREHHPRDQWKDEANPQNWQVDAVVSEGRFSTTDGKASLDGVALRRDGMYKLSIEAVDSAGYKSFSDTYFQIHNSHRLDLPVPDLFTFIAEKVEGEPGDDVLIHVGSSDEARVMVEIERAGEIHSRTFYELDNELTTIKIPILPSDRGNFAVHIVTALSGRLFYQSQVVTVPFTNKKLDLSFQTFRSKLYPGEDEQWRVTIKNAADDAEVAELMSTLYDASLEEFVKHSWDLRWFSPTYMEKPWEARMWSTVDGRIYRRHSGPRHRFSRTKYDALRYRLVEGGRYAVEYDGPMMRRRDQALGEISLDSNLAMAEAPMDEVMVEGVTALKQDNSAGANTDKPAQSSEPLQVRKNLNELAFFIPQAQTDASGNVTLTFTMPEALTAWRYIGLAHTQDMKVGTLEGRTVTQKELMIIPNMPRFLREGDTIALAAKVSNLSDTALSGKATLEILNAETLEALPIASSEAPFAVEAGGNAGVTWDFEVPPGVGAVVYRVVADAGNYSDGEEAPLPVLTNRMLVTESLQLPISDKGKKTYRFDNLANNTSSTLRHHALTLEFSPNPIWYAIQALPYLMEFPYECTEQVFSRFYANSIASSIVDANPRIKAIYDQWSRLNSDALLSNLEKNQELKTLILTETPWVRDAQDETERKRRMGVLFNSIRMKAELDGALKKIADNQNQDGGFPWFNGGRSNRYITQHLVIGMGKLMRLDMVDEHQKNRLMPMMDRALQYLDAEIVKDYQQHRQHELKSLQEIQIHYLYSRSFFPDRVTRDDVNEAYAYYADQLSEKWLDFSLHTQAMIATIFSRTDQTDQANKLIASFKERALHSEELGMYWKMERGYYWYQAPIETHSSLIEAFDEIANDGDAVNEMQLWLLKQKQVQDWKTTKATADAIYALLINGTESLAQESNVVITVGDQTIRSQEQEQQEKGTGYFKKRWSAESVSPAMAEVTVEKEDEGPAWGSLYWQYFENLDKIESAETPLSLTRQLWVKTNSSAGPVLRPYTPGDTLHVGDLVTVRIELEVDRRMEFVHLKDMRASGLEPVNVLSGHRWNQGLGYYESTRDAATNFFFANLPEGRWVFEYPLRVFQAGDFSNGISSVESMYAPEFRSHSEGIRITMGGD